MEVSLEFLAALSWVPGCIGLYFIWKQIKLMGEQNKMTDDNIKREKAIEVAKEYATLLSKDLGFCLEYLKEIYKAINLDKVKFSDIKHFDVDELEELYTKEDINSYVQAVYKPNNEQMKLLSLIYLNYFCIDENEQKEIISLLQTDWALTEEEKNILCNKNIENEKDKNIYKKILYRKYKIFFYKDKISKQLSISITESLNHLEYLCMYFTTKLADEEIVYPSLHQSFISVVRMLAITISNMNKKQSDKYYCNIIEVYGLWKDRYVSACNLEANAKRARDQLTKKY